AALLEPGIFFDPLAPKTTATRNGDTITLNGEKAYVPLAQGAEWILVYARDSESGQVDGYLVETAAVDGLTIGAREKLMGLNALELYRVTLNNVTVSAENKPEGGFPKILNHSYVALGALAVGVARASHEYAKEYAKPRIQFGAPIATKQAIAF